jgi:hypothetical protein
VTRGILDAVNRDDYTTDSPLVPDQQYELKFPLLATDYTFPAGHRIGITLVSNYPGYGVSNTTSPTAQITVDTLKTKVILPIVGGSAAALATGALPDATGPVITIGAPVAAVGAGPGQPGNYPLASNQLASYSCSDVNSGTDSCVGPVASGSAFDTSTVGSHTFTVNAADLIGNTSSASRTYNVYWPGWSGFSKPIDNVKTNDANAGSSIPLKFSLGGDMGLAIFAAGNPQSRPVSCQTSNPSGPAVPTGTSVGSTLTFANGQYTYAWKTDTTWKGTCRQLVVTLKDNTVHTALFRFK